MMNYRHLLRAFVPCLLLAAAPLLSHCGEAAGYGTETGNPPQLEEKQLYLEVVAGGIRVVGTPGAIAPPGASVRVTNVSTGASVETTAAADGSIDVVIAGQPSDELEVTVSSGGQETSERLSFSAIGRRMDLSGVSCEGLEGTLAQTVGDVFDSADVACDVDVDCVYAEPEATAPCYYDCSIHVLSRAGAAFASSQGQQQTAPLCAALEGCIRPDFDACPDASRGLPTCVAGRCQGVDPSTLTCDDFLEPAETRRAQLRAEANKACVANADCGLAEASAPCLAECSSAVESVAQSDVAGLETRIRDEANSPYCTPFFARGCSLPDLDCPAPLGSPEAFCDAGSCALRYSE